MKQTDQPLGLADALELVRNGNITDPRLMEFSKAVESVATDVLGGKDNEYLTGCIEYTHAMVMAQILVGELCNPRDLPLLLEVMLSPSFTMIVAAIFKTSVGLAVYEELR